MDNLMPRVSMSWNNLEPWEPAWAERLDPEMPDHHNTRERMALRAWLASWLASGREGRNLVFAVTGSRSWHDWRIMWAVLSAVPGAATMRNGLAKGADNLALSFWRTAGGHVSEFEPDWRMLGKRAGHVRNEAMITPVIDLVIGFLDHSEPSKGTRDALDIAHEIGLPTFVFHQKGA